MAIFIKKKESHEYQVYNLRTMHQKTLDYGKEKVVECMKTNDKELMEMSFKKQII